MLIWLDPGGTTGWALMLRNGGFACGQAEGLWVFGEWLDDVLTRTGVSVHIGWEAYLAVGPRSGESTQGLRVMGVAAWLASRHGARILPEVPSEMRNPASPEALKRLNWYRPGQPHAVDASRHLLAYLMRTGSAPELVRKAFTDPTDGGTT